MDAATSTPNGTQDESLRKSGRAIRRPDIFAEEDHQGSILSNGSAKRKRTPISKAANTDQDQDLDSEEESEDTESESEADEEEMKEKRRAQRNKPAMAKPATKRAKTANTAGTTLAIRSANIPSRPATKTAKKQNARARPSQMNKEGLFAEVFGRGQSGDSAAGHWMSLVRKDSVAAIRDLVNFVFECIGCDLTIQNSDIEDIDNVTNKLGDVLDEYAQNKMAEYPLISKSRQYAEFKTVLVDFFSSVIMRLHYDAILYDQMEVFDNINVWVATMSGASYRPFRHTATVISLAIGTALCEIAKEIQGSMATTKTQLDAEKKKKKSVNKARVSSIQENMKADGKKLETIDTYLRDLFDTVYVHRYRDVDEKIRVECVAALGSWIGLYRKMFLEGQYLRYLGWIMSDPNSPTRLEVVKQLKILFKSQRNIPALRAFTDRFRSRMVEMGARDADVSVRVESIELLDRLRNAELLEPNDIDIIGRLIFDSESRVRKAVAKFFVANIEDLYKLSIEDYDPEQYQIALPALDDSEDTMSPNQAWIKFKCLAQVLASYDKDSASDHADDHRGPFRTEDSESRYMLATQAIFAYMPELNDWESLAGYLLYDHSSISASPDDNDVNLAVQGAYKLVTGEEAILLDVLYLSVKMYLASILEQQPEKKGGRTKASKDEAKKKQETAAHNLSTIIPQLLSRYGSTPQAATSILRLEQLLDVDLINDLQTGEGGSSYSAILEDINKQFTSHSDRKVLAEASKALRTARGYEQSKEAADAKVKELWDDSSAALFSLLKGKNVETRGTLERTVLSQVADTCIRCANLASIADCTDVLEAKNTTKKGKGKAQGPDTLLGLSLDLLKRGIPDEETTEAFSELEDQLCFAVATVLSFYFRWKVVGLKSLIEKNETTGLGSNVLVGLAQKKASFVEAITPVIAGRLPLDPVRCQALLTTLDLYTLFATIKNMRPQKGELDEDIKVSLQGLAVPFDEELWKEVMTTLERMEKALARKTNRKIETESKKKGRKQTVEREEETQEEIEKPPEDSDDDDSDNESADDGDGTVEGSGREAKRQASLMAEQALCELGSKIVLAIFAGVVPGREHVKERLRLNRTKLGKSWGQVVAYLDEKKEKTKSKSARVVTPTKKSKVVVPVQMEVEGDEIEDEDMEGRDEDGGLDDDEDEGEDGDGEAEGTGAAHGDEVEAERDDDVMGD